MLKCRNATCTLKNAAVAHLVERHLAKVEVASSSLVSRSKKRKHRLKVGAFCFIRRITPSPLRGHTRTFRRSCGLDAGGEIDPNPGMGDFRPRRAGAFCRLRRRGVRSLRRAGSVPPSAAGELLPGGSRGLQKGVQDTTKDVVSYTPSCDSP